MLEEGSEPWDVCLLPWSGPVLLGGAGAGGWPPRPARKGLSPAQRRLRSVCGGIVSGLQAYTAHRLCCGFALHSWHFCSCLGPSRPVTLGCTWVRPRSQRLLGAGPSHSCKPCALEPQASVCASRVR